MSASPDYRRAARMAYRALLARQVKRLPIDPLPLLRACRDTRVYTDAEAIEARLVPPEQIRSMFMEADAVTWRFPSENQVRYIIIYRPAGNPARLRFTLAHELGHRLLGHTGSTWAEEQEADCFASHLLCPEPVLRRLTARYGALPPEGLAAVFYVSRACGGMLRSRRMPEIEPALMADVDALLWEAADQQNLLLPHRSTPKMPE